VSALLRRMLSVAVAVVIALITAGTNSLIAAGTASAATTPTAFSGTFSSCCVVLVSFRQADGNTFESVTDSVTFAGDLAGSSAEQINIVIHSDGSIEFQGSDVCACTVAGRSGTIVMPFSGNGAPNGSTIGHISIGDGTGGLANLHGRATFLSSNGGTSGTVSGVYHFDP
jgi:Protein of unknown function (DUF3224)